MKKFIAIIMAVVMVMSFATIAFAANGFTDVSKSRYETAINELYDLGIVNGYSATKFGTDYTLTRAEACAIIVRALYGEKTVPDVINFTDVSYRDWFYDYVNTAVYYDIIHGHNATTFAPNDEITYDQMATLVLNALGYNAPQLAGEWPVNIERMATRLGLYTNIPIYFDGSEYITRGEACQMLYNALDCYVVEYVRGRIIETDYTLYEAMGFDYEPTPAPTPDPVKPVNPPVADNQILGIVNFVEEYTFGENNEYKGYEIVFDDNNKIYKTASTKIIADGKLNGNKLTEATEANLGRGDYVWLERTYSNSDVYKIVAVTHFSEFHPDAGPDDTPVHDSTGTGADGTGTSITYY
ncbi:MAG: S-layer homology domain-containing protein [Clostridium sp.]|nr:S-layer homology domain-containing protein [Clostridium sp.]